jgi:hypothetical protein
LLEGRSVTGEMNIGRVVGGRFELHSGPHAYRGKEDCRDVRCTRMGDRCFGWHCAHCHAPSSYQGHLASGRYVNGEFRKFKDGEMWLSCQPGYEEAEFE